MREYRECFGTNLGWKNGVLRILASGRIIAENISAIEAAKIYGRILMEA